MPRRCFQHPRSGLSRHRLGLLWRWRRLADSWDRFILLEQKANDGTYRHDIAFLWSVGWDVKNAVVEAFDVLGGLLTFEREERLPSPHHRAIGLEPADEHALIHVPAQPGYGNR